VHPSNANSVHDDEEVHGTWIAAVPYFSDEDPHGVVRRHRMDLNTSQLYIDPYIAVRPKRSGHTQPVTEFTASDADVRHADTRVHPKVIDRQRGRRHDRISLAAAHYRYSAP
jgi:hypothetical protein